MVLGSPSIYKDAQSFILCLLFHLALPLFPIFLELVFTKTISIKSITITTAMYSISIGISSKEIVIFSITVLISIASAAIFGFISGISSDVFASLGITKEVLDQFSQTTFLGLEFIQWVYITLASIISLHIIERIIRHFLWHEVFPPFREM